MFNEINIIQQYLMAKLHYCIYIYDVLERRIKKKKINQNSKLIYFLFVSR